MDEVEKLVRKIFTIHGETWKIPLDEREEENYDYEENYIVQKRLYHHELRKHIMEEGHTREQAEKIITEAVLREIIDLKGMDPEAPRSEEMDQYALANEEYWVEEEYESMSDFVIEEILDAEPQKYVQEFYFNRDDKDEEKLREVYAEYNEKELRREELILGLVGKGYTEKEAEQLIEKYTTQEYSDEEKKNWDLADRLFKRPKYKPLRHYRNRVVHPRKGGKSIISIVGEPVRVQDSYEIMQPSEWYVEEYGDIEYLRRERRYIYGTRKVPFRTIRKIFREAEKQGKKTLTKTELKQKIMGECGATEEEAETAIHGADLTFKIRALQDPLWQMWNEEPFKGEPRYYWSGTTAGYPPLTYQDRIFTLITKSLQEAEAEGKQALTHRELVEGAYKNFEEYRWDLKAIVQRELKPELLETLIEDAQELQIIVAHEENGETKYSLNHQILQATQKNKKQRKTKKQKKKTRKPKRKTKK